MIKGIEVAIDKSNFLSSIDYARLMKYCLPFEDKQFIHYDNMNRLFLIHPSHINSANRILKNYNVHININQQVVKQITAKPEKKVDMPIEIKFIETGVIIKDKKKESFVPSRNLDILFNIIKENDSLTSRDIFTFLIREYNLFPTFIEIIKFINQSNLSQTKKDLWTSELFEYRNSAFEGLRSSKKNKEDKTDYYHAYWFPSLALRRLGLIEQSGTGKNLKLSLTNKGKLATTWNKVS
jgi:hypothetical protein